MYAYETLIDLSAIEKLSIPEDIKLRLKKANKAKLIIMFDEDNNIDFDKKGKQNPLYALTGLVKEVDIKDGSVNHDRDIYK